MARNYYVILGVDADADQQQIRKAYRRQVAELHPDRYGPDREPFLELQEAYAVLADPVRRGQYDRLLRASLARELKRAPVAIEKTTGRGPVEPLSPDEAGLPLEDVSLSESFYTFHPSREELFERLWSNFSRVERPKGERVEGVNVEVPLTAEQARRGGSVRVMVPAQVPCSACNGRGGIGLFECWRCTGNGVITGEFPVTVDYPAGTLGHTVSVPLSHYGIRNMYMTVHFRVGAMSEW